ncbi:wd-40 repeat protein : Uncultured bacterium genome assembly Metasoil_fosmids_resub OS=uncultured bacterium PE=4 SV=1: Sigma70_r2: Sigma70_r4_2: WD40: WD40: WD40 [Gemmata massiliana]|uniref:ECF RNA polymerase sigma factor SigE n=1 Tax=Gemmata massiliana TaxID=1210884 RepID=A0A6P2CUW8_9BACT|nr:sigma-70 family RNA polymerase sigma factor [Gemmata massiliana]VTR92769.1 wd-40 repeat protein : Uncultured bacterium genome assembly Metasoil_fosmids_resub OS=uncultured bacterium PE=4 SV=1: Sigma70_r2: Sigma70_r4_2: WD40: WD40: WD40 [Gemmata massiliana]
MGRDVPRGLAHYIRDMAGLWRSDARTDRELLSAFVSGDGPAFAALVVRHGQTVWSACRRVLGNDADTEDAFQATFIALARNAGHVRSDSISGWLQKVSHTVAVNARKAARRRNTVERRLLDRANRSDEQFPDEELRAVVGDEVACLPERLRVPLTLYYLEGKTQAEIGRILGVTDRAAAHRLKQALKLLRERLARRGVTVAATALAAVLGHVPIVTAVPIALVTQATEIALAVAAGNSIDTAATRLALEATRTHGWARLKLYSLVLVSVACAMIGGALLAQRGEPPAESGPRGAPNAPLSGDMNRTDWFGDQLPAGALARLGTVRFRTGGGTGLSSVAFGPAGKMLISSHGEDTVHFWDLETGREVRKLRAPRACWAVTTALNGNRLVAAGIDEIWAWDLADGAPRFLWKMQSKSVGFANVEFSPDGTLIAHGGDAAEQINLLDAATGAVVRTLAGHGERFAFSADSKSLASWKWWEFTEVGVWDVATGAKQHTFVASSGKKGVSSAAFAPSGKWLATAGQDGELRVWDLDRGTERYHLASDADPNAFVGFGPHGSTLLEIGGGRVRSWDIDTGRTTRAIACSVDNRWANVHRLSADGTQVAVAWHSGVGAWDVTSGRALGSAVEMPHESVHPVVFSRDGATLVTSTLDVNGAAVQLWDADGRPRQRFAIPPGQLVWGCDFAADGSLSALVGTVTQLPPDPPNRISRWDARTGARLAEARLPAGVRCVAFAPDGQHMAVALAEGVALCNRATGRVVRTLPGACTADALTFSADEGTLAAFDATTGEITIWSLAGGRERKWPVSADPKVRASLRRSLALSPDGRLLAIGTEDFKIGIRVMDVATGTEVWALAGQLHGWRQEFAFAPDGRTIAACGFDGAVRVWEVASGRKRYRFAGHRSGVGAVTFSPDGRRLASASFDCTVLIWDVSTPQQPVPTDRPTAAQLWDALTAPDAAAGHRALVSLAATPETSVPLLRDRLCSDTRSTDLGDERDSKSPAHRAIVRGIEALERMGRDPAAKQLLGDLAKHPVESVSGREARRALDRLAGSLKRD